MSGNGSWAFVDFPQVFLLLQTFPSISLSPGTTAKKGFISMSRGISIGGRWNKAPLLFPPTQDSSSAPLRPTDPTPILIPYPSIPPSPRASSLVPHPRLILTGPTIFSPSPPPPRPRTDTTSRRSRRNRRPTRSALRTGQERRTGPPSALTRRKRGGRRPVKSSRAATTATATSTTIAATAADNPGPGAVEVVGWFGGGGSGGGGGRVEVGDLVRGDGGLMLDIITGGGGGSR